MGRSAGAGERGERLPGNGAGNGNDDSGVILSPPPRGTPGVGIPGATLPALPGDPPERHPRRGHPGTTLPVLPQDTFGGAAIPATPIARGDGSERDMLQGILNAHASMLAEAEACAESATEPDVVAVCRYLAESRRGEMEWLSSWLGERLGGGSPGR
ncbi:hypothetical protein [Polyangium sp. 15x6]|uniref:hypothetical protein n=1 Tax=Polyangium sp. 15x6 TaxID=3042687 RepID=UPI00249C02C5|nr:hypothetical protein [Polyangium sp. 15x6]MDI3282205.1 hypothetical protein [Polyangium sp. 15x6]